MFLLEKKKHFKSMIKFLTIRNRGHVEKGRRIKNKANRRKEIIKTRAEIDPDLRLVASKKREHVLSIRQVHKLPGQNVSSLRHIKKCYGFLRRNSL